MAVSCKPPKGAAIEVLVDRAGGFEFRALPLGHVEVRCKSDDWQSEVRVALLSEADPQQRVDLEVNPIRALGVFVRDSDARQLDRREARDVELLQRCKLEFTTALPIVGQRFGTIQHNAPLTELNVFIAPGIEPPCWYVRTLVTSSTYACISIGGIVIDAAQVRQDESGVTLRLAGDVVRSAFGTAVVHVEESGVGGPVAGVRVFVVDADGGMRIGLTDTQGKARFDLLVPGTLEVGTRSREFVTQATTADVQAGSETQVGPLSLQRGVRIKGQVRHADGREAKATVVCRRKSAQPSPREPSPEVIVQRGSFSVGPLTPDIYVLRAWDLDAPGNAAQIAANSEVTVDASAGSVTDLVITVP
jgi:hypothetical protein